MAGDVSVNLFGPLTARVNGRLVGRFRSAKTVALLGYLICEQRPLARDFLADLLWPEIPLSQARGLLRRSLYDLNHNLPGVILSDYHTIQLNPDHLPQTDIALFAALRRRTDAASLEAAAELCRGPLLEGLTVEGGPDFETWLTLEREHWERHMVETLEALADLRTQTADFGRAADACWQILKLEPWREDIYRQLMVLLARAGNPCKALSVYNTCRQIVADELGVELSEATTHVYERIRDLAIHPTHPFPFHPSQMFGRGRELATLFRLLADPRISLITLTGPYGAGKSRLAVEVGWRIRRERASQFLDGVCLVRLDKARTAEELMEAMSCALTAHAGHEVRGEVQHYLGNRELLLIVDDFEHLLPYRDVLQGIIDEATGVKLLVTSQEPLGLPDECVLSLPGLSTRRSPDVELSDAACLFLDCVRRYGRPELLADERAAVEHICDLVEGLPLAIELSAALVGTMSCQEIVTRLESSLDLLLRKRYPLIAGHLSIQAALDAAWERLADEEKEALCRLARLSGGFNATTAQAVGVPGELLAALVDKSLVLLGDAGEPHFQAGPCHLHPLVRRYVLTISATPQKSPAVAPDTAQ